VEKEGLNPLQKEIVQTKRCHGKHKVIGYWDILKIFQISSREQKFQVARFKPRVVPISIGGPSPAAQDDTFD